MIFHEADNSLEIPYLIFFRKFEKMSQNLSSAAVVIDALMVKMRNQFEFLKTVPDQTSVVIFCFTISKITKMEYS